VISVNPKTNQVIVGPKEALARNVIEINNCNWLSNNHDDVMVKFRSVMRPVPARIHANDDGTAKIELETPQYGIAPGQAAVCYDNDRVLGGGWIVRTSNAA